VKPIELRNRSPDQPVKNVLPLARHLGHKFEKSAPMPLPNTSNRKIIYSPTENIKQFVGIS
jgi:hypothetical protein